MTKAITDFSRYTASELAPVAQQIREQMLAAVTTFPAPPITMSVLGDLIRGYTDALAAKASRDTTKIIAFNVARHELEGALGIDADYVNSIADGDATKVAASGYPFYETSGRHPDTAPPAAPANVRPRQGDVSGSLIARYQPSRPQSMNLVQTCLADPNVEANWKLAGMFLRREGDAERLHSRHERMGACGHRRPQGRDGRLERSRQAHGHLSTPHPATRPPALYASSKTARPADRPGRWLSSAKARRPDERLGCGAPTVAKTTRSSILSI